MGLGELRDFFSSVKGEYDKPKSLPRSSVYEKVFKELKQEQRKLLLDIIHDPNFKESKESTDLASRIKELKSQIQSKDQPFKSQRATGSWKSFCRIMSNIFEGRVSSNKIPKEILTISNLPTKPPEPIIYKHGEVKSRDVIPRNKNKRLGKGNVADAVYEHGKDSKLAVKKGDFKEYEIGATLRHPNLAKTYQFYKKTGKKNLQGNERVVNRFVMDKVEGKSMTNYYRSGNVLSNKEAVKLLTQAKDCCGYLFDQNVVWKDVNDGNIFIENKSKNLKLIDFGFWKKEEDPKKKGLELLLGAMELSGWVIRNTEKGKSGENNVGAQAFRSQVLFPEKFFGEKIDYKQIVSYFGPSYQELKPVIEKMEKMNDEELKIFVTSYFDHVIAEFEKAQGAV